MALIFNDRKSYFFTSMLDLMVNFSFYAFLYGKTVQYRLSVNYSFEAARRNGKEYARTYDVKKRL